MKVIIPSCLLDKKKGLPREKRYYFYRFVEVGERMSDEVTVCYT